MLRDVPCWLEAAHTLNRSRQPRAISPKVFLTDNRQVSQVILILRDKEDNMNEPILNCTEIQESRLNFPYKCNPKTAI